MTYGWLTGLIAAVLGGLSAWVVKKHVQAPAQPVEPPVMPPEPLKTPPTALSPAERVYGAAKASLEQKLTDQIDPSNGCAESVGNVLKRAGFTLPATTPTVNGIIQWMLANGFRETTSPVAGCVVTAHRVNVLDTAYAHCGIVMKFGIASNDSRPEHLGLFLKNYTSIGSWTNYYGLRASKTRFFLPC